MDVWATLNLGQLFPGLANGMGNIADEGTDLLNKYNALKDQMSEKVEALNQILNDSSSLLDDLASSGFYTLMMPPQSGGWQDRINSAGGSTPPNNGITCGMVVLFRATDLQESADKYENLTNILTKPFSVPK